MKQCLEVSVYGCSVFLAEIEAALKVRKGVRVQWLGNSLVEALWEIKMIAPQVILFEMNGASQAVVHAIEEEYPGVKLMGLEQGSGIMTVIFAGNRTTVSSGEELTQLIKHYVN